MIIPDQESMTAVGKAFAKILIELNQERRRANFWFAVACISVVGNIVSVLT